MSFLQSDSTGNGGRVLAQDHLYVRIGIIESCPEAHWYRAKTPFETKRRSRIIIIGGNGVFGLSLRRYLSSIEVDYGVTAFDSNEKGAACDDTHKIVRIQYASQSRTETAREADTCWTTDLLLRQYYDRRGRIEITNDVKKLDAIDAHLPPRERLTLATVQARLNSSNLSKQDRRCLQFIANILGKVEEDPEIPEIQCIWNKDNAIIDWNPCMLEVRRRLPAIQEVRVEKLVVDGKGRISALQLEGKVITIDASDKVIMTTGAWGENLLRYSNISSPIKGFRAVGVFTFHLKLDTGHREYLDGLPALSFQNEAINCKLASLVPHISLY